MEVRIVDAFGGIRAKALACTIEGCAEAGCGGPERF
jgi:hypothetical protein